MDVYSNKEFMDHLKTGSEFPYIDEVCAEINRAPRAYVPELLRANVSLR